MSPYLGILIPNPTKVHRYWELTNTLIVHNLLHLRLHAIQKLHTFWAFSIPSLIMRKVPHQLLKLGCIFSHCHVPLLELQELHLFLLPNIFRKVFIHKYSLKGFLGHSLTFSLQALASVLPPIPSFLYHSVCTKRTRLLLWTCHHSKDFLNLSYPILSTIRVVSSTESGWIVLLEVIQPLILSSSHNFSPILIPQSLSKGLESISYHMIIPSSRRSLSTPESENMEGIHTRKRT